MLNFSMPVRVYIEDTDAGGIVYYANYLKYMERARTECLRSCGVELDEWQQRHRRLFVVRKVEIDFHLPARFNDQLTVCANVMTLKPASLVCDQPVTRGDDVLVTASVKLACVDADTLTPVAIPSSIREAMTCER